MKKALKIFLKTFISLLVVVILVVGVYVGYVFITYNRIEDNLSLKVEQKSRQEMITTGKEYTISTYNIGFGAYSQDYTFFLDEGKELDGTSTVGRYAKARNKEEVTFNTTGAIETIKNQNPDFCFFQEVDTKSNRSYHVNQHQMITENFDEYDAVHAVNFHSAYFVYPFNDMMGKANSGITTLSKYSIQQAVRKKFTVTTSFSKFFDLDRCFSVSSIAIDNNKSLQLVNVHMSAYDEGGIIRKAQRDELNAYINEAYSKGDYILIGGDFNHDLLTYNPDYNYDLDHIPFKDYIGQQKPDWLQYFFENDGTTTLDQNFKVVASDNAPTCRDSDIEWEIGHTFVSAIDGFIVSNNIEVVSANTIVTKNGNKGLDHFAYSDHDPVKMVFKLK